MTKFRKKPVVVEAFQFPGFGVSFDFGISKVLAFEDWLYENGGLSHIKYKGNTVVISTLEGDMIGLPGDWIIKGTNGEFYPCKPEIFKEIYEPVDE